jgi:hypothetical protein
MHAIARTNILNFVKDFELKKPIGIISFEAVIDFEIDEQKIEAESEVQIITSGNLEAVYLINEKISKHKLPDLFTSAKENFLYINNKCLEIKGTFEGRDFVVNIYPRKNLQQ